MPLRLVLHEHNTMPRSFVYGDFAALPPLLDTTWPEALPHPEEERFLSVICEKQALWWCLHTKDSDDIDSTPYPWKAAVFWKSTASLLETPRDNLTLRNFIPPAVHGDFLSLQQIQTGRNDVNFLSDMNLLLSRQRIPAWTIYAVIAESSPRDVGYQKALQQIFCQIPNRMYFLSANDFVAEENVGYATRVTLSQLASLKAIWDHYDAKNASSLSPSEAASLSASPSGSVNADSSPTTPKGKMPPTLFFHADEHVVSYVATDLDGKISREGCFPGLSSQWEAMVPFVEGLSREQLGDLLKDFPMDADQPMPSQFSVRGRNPQMLLNEMVQALQTSLEKVEAEWKKCCLGDNSGSTSSPTGSLLSRPVIFVDGLHSKLVHHLLVRSQPTESQQTDIVVVDRQTLAHYGVAALLREKVLQFAQFREEEGQLLSRFLVGQRLLHSREELGTVVAVIKGALRDSYRVQFDRGHWRDYNLRELPAELQRFHGLSIDNSLVKVKQKGSYQASLKILEITERARPALQKRPREQEELNGSQHNPKKLATDANGKSYSSVQVPIDLTEPPASQAVDVLAERNKAYVGRRIAKFFGNNVLYFGTVTEWNPPEPGEEDVDLWLVVYDDGDMEDMDRGDLDYHFRLYEAHKSSDARARTN